MPWGLIRTTTTLASGFLLESLTRPVILTIVSGLAGVSTRAVTGDVTAVSGVGVAFGSGVASGDEVGDDAGGRIW